MKKSLITLAIFMCSGAAFADCTGAHCVNPTVVTGGSASGGTAYGGDARTTSGPAITVSGPATTTGGTAYGGVARTTSGPATTTGGTAYGGVGGTVGPQTVTQVAAQSANNSNAGIVGQGGAGGSANSTNINLNSAEGGAGGKGGSAAATATNTGNTQVVNTVDENSLEVAKVQADAIKTAARRHTPSIVAAQLTSSNDTCMGSASGSASGPGFGISIGKTYLDENCVMLKNARELWNMGRPGAALARMCMNAANREALELDGYVCPTRGRVNVVNVYDEPADVRIQSAPVAEPTEYTDPYIRQRLNLPKIAE